MKSGKPRLDFRAQRFLLLGAPCEPIERDPTVNERVLDLGIQAALAVNSFPEVILREACEEVVLNVESASS